MATVIHLEKSRCGLWLATEYCEPDDSGERDAAVHGPFMDCADALEQLDEVAPGAVIVNLSDPVENYIRATRPDRADVIVI